MRAATALAWLATLLYPLAIWLGLAHFEPRWLALLLLAMALLRAAVSREAVWLAAAACAAGLVVASMLSNDGTPLKLYPFLVNVAFLTVFSTSLRRPPTVIERLARLQHPELPPEAIPYLRKVTLAWCVFFFFNGSVALYTAIHASDAAWALYNGLIAYGLIGAMLLGERVIRPRHDA